MPLNMKLWAFFTCSLLGMLPAAPMFAAETILNTGGFEDFDPFDNNEGYEEGNLLGQQNWTTAGTSGSVATVQDDTVHSGDQALQVDRVGNSNRRWAVPVNDYPTGRYVTIAWDMAVAVTQQPGIFGPFFGVEAYDDSDVFGVLGTLGVDATTGEILVQEEDTGFLVAPGPIVTSHEWNRYSIELDFSEGEYSTFLNGAHLTTTGFVDGGLGLDSFTDADIATFAAAGDSGSQNEPGTAWFDNFLVLDGLAGDFNGDDVVDAADYTVWRDALGESGLPSTADATGDGKVDIADYQVWSDNYGRSNLAAPSLSTAAVPEPHSAVLVGLAMTLAAFGVRRRRLG